MARRARPHTSYKTVDSFVKRNLPKKHGEAQQAGPTKQPKTIGSRLASSILREIRRTAR